jgi:hypothetical protein
LVTRQAEDKKGGMRPAEYEKGGTRQTEDKGEGTISDEVRRWEVVPFLPPYLSSQT